MFVEYENGSFVAFNYRNGNIVGKETNKDIGLGEYIKEYFEVSKDNSSYSEENKDYLEAKELVKKLNEHPIESVVGDTRFYGGIPAKNSTYTISYNTSSGDYTVYQMPTAESGSDLQITKSFDESVDSIIDKDDRLIEFYRVGESNKVTFVSAFIIVFLIVGFIGVAILILAKYLKKSPKKITEGI